MERTKQNCIWCGFEFINKSSRPNKYYCLACEENCERECICCHKPYPSLKYFKKHKKRCNSCQKRLENAAQKNNERKFGIEQQKPPWHLAIPSPETSGDEMADNLVVAQSSPPSPLSTVFERTDQVKTEFDDLKINDEQELENQEEEVPVQPTILEHEQGISPDICHSVSPSPPPPKKSPAKKRKVEEKTDEELFAIFAQDIDKKGNKRKKKTPDFLPKKRGNGTKLAKLDAFLAVAKALYEYELVGGGSNKTPNIVIGSGIQK